MNRKLTLTVLLAAIAMAGIAALLVLNIGPGKDQGDVVATAGDGPDATPTAEEPAPDEAAGRMEAAEAQEAPAEPTVQATVPEAEPEEAVEPPVPQEPAAQEPTGPSPTPEEATTADSAVAPQPEPEPETSEATAPETKPAEAEPAPERPAMASAEAPQKNQGTAAESSQEVTVQPSPETLPSETQPTRTPAASEKAGTVPAQAPAPNPQPQPVTETEAPAPSVPAGEQLAALPEDGGDVDIDLPAATPPSFDVVRVESNGDAVLAGRAEPGSLVILEANGEKLGEARADSAGEWLMILDWALKPGSHQLSLMAETPRGEQLLSESVVVVAVPEPQPRKSPAAQATAEASPPAAEEQTAMTGDAAAPAPQTAEESEPPSDTKTVVTPVDEEQAADPPAVPVGTLAVEIPRAGGGASQVLQVPEERGIVDRDLVLAAIEYDPDSRVIVSGQAAPGAQVLLYIDNKPVGRAVADENGRWSLSPDAAVAVGLHRLRIDQVDASGSVVARVETPFSRADALVDLLEDRFVVVQPGNSLWRIARRTYGEGVRYSVIYQSNQSQIRDPDLIYPGQIFLVPEVN